MPVSMPNNQQVKYPARPIKRVIYSILTLLVLITLGVGVFTGYIKPRLIAYSVNENIEAINIISGYTKQFEQHIIQAIDDQDVLTVNKQSQISSQLDSLYSRALESKNNLDQGYFESTREFYATVFESFNSFLNLLTLTDAYLDYQFCLTNSYDSVLQTQNLTKSLFDTAFTTNSLVEAGDVFNQIATIYQLRIDIYTDLGMCFGKDQVMSLSEQNKTIIDNYVVYLENQKSVLDSISTDVVAADDSAIELKIQQLSENELSSVPFFGSDEFEAALYMPLEIIQYKNKELVNSYSRVSDDLRNIKAKYQLS